MTRNKKRKRLRAQTVEELPIRWDLKKVPFKNLPNDFLWMEVKSGTKMRNVLQYAFEHFPNRGTIVWSAIGQGIGKVISCAEIFKRKYPGLHQATKLRYAKSSIYFAEEGSTTTSNIPEIHIFFSEKPTYVNEPGYQPPGDIGEFPEAEGSSTYKRPDPRQMISSGRITSLAAEEFAAMGLRTGQKRSRREQNTETPFKKNKKKESAKK